MEMNDTQTKMRKEARRAPGKAAHCPPAPDQTSSLRNPKPPAQLLTRIWAACGRQVTGGMALVALYHTAPGPQPCHTLASRQTHSAGSEQPPACPVAQSGRKADTQAGCPTRQGAPRSCKGRYRDPGTISLDTIPDFFSGKSPPGASL